MKFSKCTVGELEAALKIVNKEYAGNLRLEVDIHRRLFSLRVKELDKPGMSVSYSGRRSRSACWHAHGHFFDALFLHINPGAVIYSRGNKITKNTGNWEHYNVGSSVSPVDASEQCYCSQWNRRYE